LYGYILHILWVKWAELATGKTTVPEFIDPVFA
jgi:hypothetical protein